MTNRDFKDAFTDILRHIFCVCCPSRTDDGFPRNTRFPGGIGSSGLGGPMTATGTDKQHVDYV